ncbi:hypothetical protein HPB48_007818 [Haemaphysalis longicornis]|uniref:Tick transposon n=1 Tax=Haemaphysalis longicornis TaxID=44386 RepID=A0A9J6FZH8_HAELO|nr:hypothetical protein HPB48_007818 [Haemaphysalis longicornis]
MKHLTVLRYVDDYLVVVNRVAGTSLNDVLSGVIETFVSSSKSLKFTWELPSNNCLRFLDLILTVQDTHVCWQYKPRANKQLIPFDSAHSKLIKRGVAKTCITAALNKSCAHKVQDAFNEQIARLSTAGFSSAVVSAVCEALLQKFKQKQREGDMQKKI